MYLEVLFGFCNCQTLYIYPVQSKQHPVHEQPFKHNHSSSSVIHYDVSHYLLSTGKGPNHTTKLTMEDLYLRCITCRVFGSVGEHTLSLWCTLNTQCHCGAL